jgi:hypothetical protein
MLLIAFFVNQASYFFVEVLYNILILCLVYNFVQAYELVQGNLVSCVFIYFTLYPARVIFWIGNEGCWN